MKRTRLFSTVDYILYCLWPSYIKGRYRVTGVRLIFKPIFIIHGREAVEEPAEQIQGSICILPFGKLVTVL